MENHAGNHRKIAKLQFDFTYHVRVTDTQPLCKESSPRPLRTLLALPNHYQWIFRFCEQYWSTMSSRTIRKPPRKPSQKHRIHPNFLWCLWVNLYFENQSTDQVLETIFDAKNKIAAFFPVLKHTSTPPSKSYWYVFFITNNIYKYSPTEPPFPEGNNSEFMYFC